MATHETDAEHLNLLYKKAVQNAMDSIMITGPELDEPGPRIIYVNPAFTKMTGYSLDESVGRSPRFLQGKDTDWRVLRKVGRLLRKGLPVREEIINYRKDGRQYTIEWHIAPVKEGSVIVNWVSIQKDITERKRLEEKLASERLHIENKVRQRTAELEVLKTRIESYSRKLEYRLLDMERRITGLSEREKAVLAAIACFPDATDTELAKETGIKRSTFTSIRGRLKARGDYSEIYVPDPIAIGCEAVGVEFGELSDVQKKTRHVEESLRKHAVFYISSATHYAAIIFYRTYAEAFKKSERVFPAGFFRFSFSAGLAGLFGKKAKPVKTGAFVADTEILKMIIEHPDWTAGSIADFIGLSPTTVMNARKRLIDDGSIRKDVMPKIKGFYPIVLLETEQPTDSIHAFVKIETVRGCIYIGWTKEEAEHTIIFGRNPKMILSFGNALE